MLLLFDPHRGYVAEEGEVLEPRLTRLGIVHSSGLDRLDWGLPEPETVEFSAPVPETKKGLKQQRKEAREEKKLAASRRRAAKRQQEMSVSENTDFNPFVCRKAIKDLFMKTCQLKPDLEASRDHKVLQYHLVALYKSDLEHLMPGEWLNDNNILLVYELVEQTFLNVGDLRSQQITLLLPALVHLILHYPNASAVEALLPVSELKKLKFVFIPVNFLDDYDVDLESDNNGDHWALCVLNLIENKLLVYDSMETEDDDKLVKELVKRLQFCPSLFRKNSKIDIVRMKCAQQDNFDDCGVYVVMVTCYLMRVLLGDDDDGYRVNLDISNVRFNALEGRRLMMEIVFRLAATAANKEV